MLNNKEEINILKDIESSYYKNKINDNTWKKICNSKKCFTLNIEIPTVIMENKFNVVIGILKENVLDKLVNFNF